MLAEAIKVETVTSITILHSLIKSEREIRFNRSVKKALSLSCQNKLCYQAPSRLFVIGGVELKSSEGTTQGDPITMTIYTITVIPLILRTVDSVVASK